jgi:hypothetical protein
MNTATNGASKNRTKMSQVEIALAAILSQSLHRGFYGKAVLELTVQDGMIQNIRRIVEKVDR